MVDTIHASAERYNIFKQPNTFSFVFNVESLFPQPPTLQLLLFQICSFYLLYKLSLPHLKPNLYFGPLS